MKGEQDEAAGNRWEQHPEQSLLRRQGTHHQKRGIYQRNLWFFKYPAQADRRGEARCGRLCIRPARPNLPAQDVRGVQGSAKRDAQRAGLPATAAQGPFAGAGLCHCRM